MYDGLVQPPQFPHPPSKKPSATITRAARTLPAREMPGFGAPI